MNAIMFSVAEGLSGVLADEVKQRLGVQAEKVADMRGSELLRIPAEVDAKAATGIKTCEDVFLTLGRIRLSGQLVDLKSVERMGLWGSPLREALDVWSHVRGEAVVKRMTFRVVVQAEDAAWRRYRRSDIVLAAERGLIEAGSSWRVNRDEAPLEIWLQQVGRELIVNVRLTTNVDRQHGGREVEREAALRPSIAAAMVWLSEPQDDDVFMDPMCGSGTILLERAVMGRYELLLGGDVDPAAVQATLANFGPRHQPRRIERWDATSLPVPDSSITTVACNLPWGRKISEQSQLPALYKNLFTEWSRVLAPGGRMVLLTSEWDMLKDAAEQSGLVIRRSVPNVRVMGRRADIFVLSR
jgi:tRNA (guanine6-N2)-methyltransferase